MFYSTFLFTAVDTNFKLPSNRRSHPGSTSISHASVSKTTVAGHVFALGHIFAFGRSQSGDTYTSCLSYFPCRNALAIFVLATTNSRYHSKVYSLLRLSFNHLTYIHLRIPGRHSLIAVTHQGSINHPFLYLSLLLVTSHPSLSIIIPQI